MNLRTSIHKVRAALAELADIAAQDGIDASEDDAKEELHKLAGWASGGSGKLRKLLDPQGTNALCEALGQQRMDFRALAPRESYPGETADNAPVPRRGGVESVTLSSGERSVTMTGDQFHRASEIIGSGSNA